MSGDLSIRPARPDESEMVAGLVAELATQQGDATEHISAATFRRDAAAPRPEFEVLIAESGGAIVGYSLFHDAYEPSYSARGFYVCDIYVRPQARRQGIGRALVAAVAAAAKTRGRIFLWWVAKPWNADALAFYEAMGAVATPVVAHALTFEHFERLAEEAKTDD
jgi:GNAT superfamily N-acetyltransferase